MGVSSVLSKRLFEFLKAKAGKLEKLIFTFSINFSL